MVFKIEWVYLLLCRRPIWKTGSNDVYFKGSCLMSHEFFKRCKYMYLELSSHPRSLIMITYINSVIYFLAKIFTDSSVQLFETRRFHVSCNAMQGTWRSTRDMRGKILLFFRSRWKLASLSSSNTFQFLLLWLILEALVSIKELEENQENSSSTVMVAFYLSVVA